MQQVVRFAGDDEAGYRSWLAANPTGYVINERSHGKYLVLHKAHSAACISQPGKSHTSSSTSTQLHGVARLQLFDDGWRVLDVRWGERN